MPFDPEKVTRRFKEVNDTCNDARRDVEHAPNLIVKAYRSLHLLKANIELKFAEGNYTACLRQSGELPSEELEALPPQTSDLY